MSLDNVNLIFKRVLNRIHEVWIALNAGSVT
jgi:hypothetical protein